MKLISKNSSLRYPLLALLILTLSFYQLAAQAVIVTGNVSAGDQDAPIPGANISIKGTVKGTISDLDGNYSINVSTTDILEFSFIGYQKKEVAVGDQSIIDVVLQVESTKLDELVVIGYGTVRKSDLTGAVGSVKAADLTKITSANPEQSLQGKVSGVQVTSTSGAPGAVPTVRIRGVGTFNNSSPIFVVDGTILNDISFLNSSDIASMEVLKDASATAIYGSRGANGVIIISTKSGSMGQGKPVFDFFSEYGVQKLTKKIDLLSGREFAIISNEISPGSYNNVDAVPNTDWQDLVFHAAPMQNHQLSVSGGTENSRYYVGIGLFKQDGIIDKSGYERFTLKLNNSYNLTKSITFGNNLTISPYSQENGPAVTYAVYRAQPVLEPYYDDGSYAVVYNVGNPLADLDYSNNFNKGVRGVGNLYTDIKLLKDLTFRSSIGVDAEYGKNESFTPAYTIYNPDGSASQQQNVLNDLNKSRNEKLNWLWENTLTYNKSIGKNNFDIMAGYTMQESSSENLSLTGNNVIRDESDFWYILPSYVLDEGNGVNTISSIKNEVDENLNYSMISYLFRANYTFDGKYILTSTFRRDGSSKFKTENQYGNFPSFAAGWNIGRESFMDNLEIISNLKLRTSWGKIGNEKIPYKNRYAIVQSDLSAIFGLNPAANPGASYGKSGNNDLSWETTTQTDVGLEIGFLNNRLTSEFDYYNRVTDDILIDLSTPGYLGNGQGQLITYNAAQILNYGFEFNINWREKIGDFNYSIGALGSTIHNEVLEVGGSSGIDSVLLGGALGNGIPVTQSRVGLPIGAFFGYKTDGVFQNEDELAAHPHSSSAGVGDLRFVDVSGDGKISDKDRTFIGSPIPKFIFGLNLAMDYKGIDFSIDIQGQTGNKIFNGKEAVRPDPYNFEKHMFDRWTETNPSTTEPRASWGGYNYIPSDRFIQDGSFVRLRNVTVGYTLPKTVSEKLFVDRLRVYIKGTNLLTLTKYTGYTPEIGSSNVLSNGIDSGIYPVTTVYSFGINLTF
jgi:TonB-linked SusC/RagA family outer membrane protein